MTTYRISAVSFVRLDGSTPQTERMGIVDQFNTDPDVFAFLISTMAGGTGLNLTAANKVVIFGVLSQHDGSSTDSRKCSFRRSQLE